MSWVGRRNAIAIALIFLLLPLSACAERSERNEVAPRAIDGGLAGSSDRLEVTVGPARLDAGCPRPFQSPEPFFQRYPR